MEVFKIEGPNQLKGSIEPQGAKNEALQVISAVLLTSGEVIIRNIPVIDDVLKLIEVLKGLGVKVSPLSRHDYSFKADAIDDKFLGSREFSKLGGKLRGSVLVMGPLLARFGRSIISQPGGDKIGRRRLDTHFMAVEKLGAKVRYEPGNYRYVVEASQLKGTFIHLAEPSVTGTANAIMASCLVQGETTLYNAACEPYIQQLCRLINRMGGNITGTGTNRLVIKGVSQLDGAEHRCLPDMIEVGSFIGLAAMTQSNLTIKNAGIEHLGIIPATFRRLGIDMNFENDSILVSSKEIYEVETYLDGSILTIYDNIWPGFTPDLISIALVVATQAKGNVLIHQKMFESRLFFVDNLIDMGAQIILCDPHRATVMGLSRKQNLRGIKMRSPDIRAGVALLIAALSAEGTSVIYNIEQVDRGYEQIDRRLNKLGANIQRLEEEDAS